MGERLCWAGEQCCACPAAAQEQAVLLQQLSQLLSTSTLSHHRLVSGMHTLMEQKMGRPPPLQPHLVKAAHHQELACG